ncbi:MULTISPECIES: hypothetical protein [Enterococcaceae]|uniref:hypothetical protein n=1 Tax=Enterococcaceae TaxID=81852 RepID=UPI000E4A2AA7|nr:MULTISPECIES: hypothetical protein [Enterococcaceae]RGI31877.1 hypothetical protein DXC12_00820 [Melissococcus sp. OM08-11BH]UNM90339.1 hypothetical protein MN187_04435 [Vagococcus sp. CY52-2]
MYFSSTLVDQNKVFGTDVIDKGTSAGGYTVVGTVIIRTSDEMTATNQKELENEIINKLTTVN